MNTLLAILLQKYCELQPLLAYLMLFLFPALITPFHPPATLTFIDTASAEFTAFTQSIIVLAVCRQ